MERIIIFVLMMATHYLLFVDVCHGQNVKTFTFTYKGSDFEFSNDADGCLMIDSKRKTATYSEDFTSPALPYLHYYVLIDENSLFSDITIDTDDKLLKDSINVIPNQPPILAGSKYPSSFIHQANFSSEKYPNQRIIYTGTFEMGKYKVIGFCVSPFHYNAKNRQLYLSEKILVNIHLTNAATMASGFLAKKNAMHIDSGNDLFVSSLIENPEDMCLYSGTGNKREYLPIAGRKGNREHEAIDYMIITNSDMSNAFESLIKWKRMKGLRCKIVTTSEIYNLFPSNMSNQLKIKTFLKDYYDNGELKYVLLGGDDTIVPVQYCHMQVIYLGEDGNVKSLSDNIPADMYYACFGGDLDWDANQNGVHGEYGEDNIDLFQNISLTRLPVRLSSDVTPYVNRLISYESDPLAQGWNNKLLMAGSKLLSDTTMANGTTYSDANYWGETLYNTYLSSWPGQRIRFYDTYTDFSGGQNYDLNVPNLQSQFNIGYGFVDMMSHGIEKKWQLETGFYQQSNANQMSSPSPIFMSTSSCLTNAFDVAGSFDPCLSECFIRNSNSGVLGYYGCSRETFFPISPKYNDKGVDYIARYYQQFFLTSDDHPNHLGNTRYAKSNLISQCGTSSLYLWMMYGFNQMGDPETPVYINTPNRFNNIRINYENSNLSIEQSKRFFQVSAISLSDNGDSFYESNLVDGWSYAFNNITDSVYICLQADGYIPFFFKICNGTIYLQKSNLKGICSITGPNIIIGEDFFPYCQNTVVAIDGNTEFNASQGVSIKKDFDVPIGSTLEINTGN